jgi:hypothetical protein
MPNNNNNLQDLVGTMETIWVSMQCFKDGQFNQFHFGYPHEVDNLHNKSYPLMVCNYPNSSSVIPEYEGNVVNTTTSFVIQIYGGEPMGSTRSSSLAPITDWDAMEDCFYHWLQNCLNTWGSSVVLGSGTVQFSRRDQAANDQSLKLEVRFNLNHYRFCFGLTQ